MTRLCVRSSKHTQYSRDALRAVNEGALFADLIQSVAFRLIPSVFDETATMNCFDGVLSLLVTGWSSVVVGSRYYVGQAGLDA